MIKKILTLFMILSTAVPQCLYISLSATVCDCGRPHFFVSSIPADIIKKDDTWSPFLLVGVAGFIRAFTRSPLTGPLSALARFLGFAYRHALAYLKSSLEPTFSVGSVPARTYKRKGHQTVPLPFTGRSGGI